MNFWFIELHAQLKNGNHMNIRKTLRELSQPQATFLSGQVWEHKLGFGCVAGHNSSHET